MKSLMLIALVIANLSYNPLFSQESVYSENEAVKLSVKDSIVESSWMIGLGYNFIVDSGDAGRELLSVDSQWNGVAYPSRVSIGRYFKSGIGVEGIASYNKYNFGKIIDGATNLEETDYISLDARLSFDLNNKIIGETAWFDPYIGIGMGYTDANKQARGTYNAIIGFRTWFSDHWGLDLNSSGKWAIGDTEATNHIQHAAGILFRFGIEKGLSKKGEEKLAMINALERENQRIRDSLATINRDQEAAALAERLAKAKEAASLAAAEKEKEDVENRRKQIEQQIEDLGLVYFDLNSSYLTNSSKRILDDLAQLLKQNETVVLQVSSFTDSRGATTYNYWLSERRVERTVSYLNAQGIAKERLEAKAFGEDKLLNECDDNTYCPEEKHKINRRSEFKVIRF